MKPTTVLLAVGLMLTVAASAAPTLVTPPAKPKPTVDLKAIHQQFAAKDAIIADLRRQIARRVEHLCFRK